MLNFIRSKAKLLLFTVCIFAATTAYTQKKTRAQVQATLGLSAHAETFNCACGENWQPTWVPSKLTMSLPLSSRVSLFPSLAVGKASKFFYKPQTFFTADVNIKFDVFAYDYWIRPYIFGGVGTAYFGDATHATNDLEIIEAKSAFYPSLNAGIGFNLWFSDNYAVAAQHSFNMVPGYNNYYQASLGLITKLDALFKIYNPKKWRPQNRRWV